MQAITNQLPVSLGALAYQVGKLWETTLYNDAAIKELAIAEQQLISYFSDDIRGVVSRLNLYAGNNITIVLDFPLRKISYLVGEFPNEIRNFPTVLKGSNPTGHHFKKAKLIIERIKSQLGITGEINLVSVDKEITSYLGDISTTCQCPDNYYLVTVQQANGKLKNGFVWLEN